MKTILICTVCPNSCRVEAEYTDREDLTLRGNRCPRGIAYCTDEIFAPKRTFTASVSVSGAKRRCLPVRSASPVPREKLPECMAQIAVMKVEAPVKRHQVLLQDLADTGIPLIASMTLEKEA